MTPYFSSESQRKPIDDESCPVCGSGPLQELKCKVICANCRTILKSCADL